MNQIHANASISQTDTVVIMVSIGDRAHLTNYTFPPLAKWAARHDYSCILLKRSCNPNCEAPHFNKLLVHKTIPGFKRYIIVDDDLFIKPSAPPISAVPEGFIGVCKDAEQRNTEAEHVIWTANTGLIVATEGGLHLLEEAYSKGEYPYTFGDGTKKSIWGPFDQARLNDTLFKHNRIYELDWKWNFQPVVDFFINDKGWEKWTKSKIYRLTYYFCLLSPFPNAKNKLVKQAYGIHMVRGVYPKFFLRFIK